MSLGDANDEICLSIISNVYRSIALLLYCFIHYEGNVFNIEFGFRDP